MTYIQELDPDWQEKQDEKYQCLLNSVERHLKNYDFEKLNVAVGGDFIEWLMSISIEVDYNREISNLIRRTHFWETVDAGDIAHDYCEHLINSGTVKL